MAAELAKPKENLKRFQTIMMAYGCNLKACLLAMWLIRKKEIRTHRKKIQERLPGKQQDGSFVYGFGNFRVEERVLPVLPRHGYCRSEKKKIYILAF